VSDVLGDRVSALPFAVLLVTGAALAFAALAPLTGIDAPAGGSQWLLVVAIAVVPGVIGVTAMLAGVGMIGPSLVSILLTLEPAVTVLIAWVALGETLSVVQLAGGGLIVLAAVLVQRAATGQRPLAHHPEVPPA
jgi:drug/metabolite transporter (DMT)-like permease